MPSRRLFAPVLLALAASPASAQVVAHPNQIRGTYTITNVHPEIVAEIQARGGVRDFEVAASSRGMTPQLTARTGGVSDGPMSGRYELTVEAGDPGIAYDVSTWRYTGNGRLTGDAGPVAREPAPDAVVDFEECLALVVVKLRDLDGNRVVDLDGTVNGRRPDPGSDEVRFLVNPDQPYAIRISITTGSDPLHDTVTLSYLAGMVTASCDEVVSFEAVCDPNPCDSEGDGIALGRIVGEVDILGTELVPQGSVFGLHAATTRVSSMHGPFGNARSDLLNTSARVRGPFELENLVPSELDSPPQSYGLGTEMKPRVDGLGHFFSMGTLIAVAEGETVDVGQLLVVDPAHLRADVRLVGPPPPVDPTPRMLPAGTGPLDFDCRTRGDALPDGPACVTYSQATWAGGTYDASTGALTGTSRQVVGGCARGGALLTPEMSVGLVDGDALVTADAFHQWLTMEAPAWTDVLVSPGDDVTLPMHACVGELTLGYVSTEGPFYAPSVSTSGESAVPDFEGSTLERVWWSRAYGTPRVASAASTTGSVRLALPEGVHDLEPVAVFVGASGVPSTTELPNLRVHVGCRQVLKGRPEIVAQMTHAPPCIGSAPVLLSGSVVADADVASITWSLDGGTPVDHCRPCGHDPSYEIAVPGTGSEMSVLISAVDVLGRDASVLHVARFSEEPSAVDVDGGASPLLVSRAPDGRLHAQWGTAPGLSYSLYRGTIDALHDGRYDHAAFGACGLAEPRWTGALPDEDAYFLVTTSCGYGDGPLGRDSFRRGIPGAAPRCP